MSLLSGMALGFAGCAGEEEDLFSSSAAERLEAAVKDYTEYFAANGGKWTVEYYPTNGDEAPQGLGYLMLWDFDSDNSVKVAMNNNFTNNVYKEDASVWEIIADNGPVLSFNTYNECLHAFSDPNDIPFTTGSLNDETGLGAEGDYEFIVLNLGKDAKEGMLKGKKRSVYDRIIRLPEDTDFPTYMADIKAFHNMIFPTSAPNYAQFNFGDNIYRIDEGNGGMPNVYLLGTDAIVNESRRPFIITKHDGKYYLRFRDAMKATENLTAQEFVYDEEKQLFTEVEHPELTLTGADPTTFFAANKWQWTRSAEMSETLSELYNKVYQEFRGYKFTMNNIRFVFGEDNVLTLTLSYKPSNAPQVTISFLFDYAVEGGNVTLNFKEPVVNETSNAQAVMDLIPSLSDLLAALSDTYVGEATSSKFDLTRTKIVSATNPDKWTVVTYY